jgi:hypothetical protein
LALVLAISQPTFVAAPRASGNGNCPGADPNDYEYDDIAINACLAQGGDVILEEGVVGYLLVSGLVITQPGTRLIGADGGAVLLAEVGLNQQMLRSDGVDNVVLENLRFYGNRWERTSRLWECVPGPREHGKILLVTGNGFLISNVTALGALCGTGAEVEGSNFEIRDSNFSYNGFQLDVPGLEPWADGLTVWTCNNGWIHHNTFMNNTDVDLVIGGGSGCVVENNTIIHNSEYGFAGLMIGTFAPANGDHAGSTYRWNSIDSTYNKLGFGIMVGDHPWSCHVMCFDLPTAGSVVENYSWGAVVNLAIDGIQHGEVQSNGWGSAQGDRGFGSCTSSWEYTACHFGSASIQNGYESIQFDGGACGSCGG